MSNINTINCKSPSYGSRDWNRKQKNVFKKYLLFCCMHVFLKTFFQGFESSLPINRESIKIFSFLYKNFFQKIKAVQN